MSGPTTKKEPREVVWVPHPDDLEEVRAGLEEAERGDVLSVEESAAYLQALLGDDDASQ
jgi:hypothetical protein